MKSTRFLAALLSLLAGGCLLYSCSGSQQAVDPVQQPELVSQLPGSGLPPFPTDRETAVIVDNQLNGSQFFEKSDGALASLNALSFNVGAQQSEYAIYQFPAGSEPLVKLVMDVSLVGGRAPWVGLADFSTGRWQFGSPLATGFEEFDLSGNSGYKSPGNNFYFAVVGWDVSEFVINGANVQTDRDITYSISGLVYDPLDTLNVQDVAITLTPGGTQVLTDVNGNFSFSGLDPGNYTVMPELAGYSFTPNEQAVEITASDVTGVEFMIQDLGLPSHSVSGNVQYDMGGGLEGVTMSLSPGGLSIQTDVNGDFSIGGVVSGSYTLTPSLAGYSFAPTSINLDVTDADSTGNNFVASDIPVQTYSISGAVSVGSAFLQNVLVTVNPGGHSTVTDANGAYTISDLAPDSYTVTASKTGWLFDPPSHSVEIISSNVTGINFIATPDNNGTFSVGGIVSGPPGGLSGAVITLTPQSGPPIQGVTGSGGGYTIINVPSGIYTATASKSGWSITPFSQEVVVVDQNVTGVNWFASPPL
ncbi:MAG: carboxypeptidase regulatory-like domain-containing protein [Planctomycetales bacterium]|nr:carboxypeptidase regulatory-like domain-containing protein [bacterium]UNM08351.1 MAG: carboxypeptidase regulatory-like domain-containing protein [Planctomycetales bacterium]